MIKRFTLLLALTAGMTLASAALAQGKPKTIASTFKTGVEGWNYAANFFGISILATPDHVAAGGNPGGYITKPDGDNGNSEHIAAFTNFNQYHGDRSKYYGGLIKFDLKLNSPSTRKAETVIGSSALHTNYYAFATPNPGTDWSRYRIPLVENAWTFGVAKVSHPTKANFKDLLNKLSGVAVIADYLTTPGEIDSMDNYKLIPPKIFKRKLTLDYRNGAGKFEGRLTSADSSCRAKVRVTVRKIGRGPDHAIGTAKTNRKGQFSLAEKVKHGTFYAAVPERVKSPTICRAAASKNVNLG
jgi:Laminin B (Domain IV)